MIYDCEVLDRYTNPPCDGETHYNKIVMIALVLPDATITDYSNNTQWTADIASGAVRLIKETQGNYDGGVAVLAPGFGNQLERVVGQKHTLNFMTKYRIANHDFFNKLRGLNVKAIAIVSGDNDALQVVEKNAMLYAKAPITDDLTAERKFEVQTTWSDIDMPVPYDVPSVFLAVLSAPVASAATSILATSFAANWGAVAGAIGYIVQVATDSNFDTIIQEIEVGGVITTAVTGLTTATNYWYRVVAFSFNEESETSNTISVTTA